LTFAGRARRWLCKVVYGITWRGAKQPREKHHALIQGAAFRAGSSRCGAWVRSTAGGIRPEGETCPRTRI
jgi:hypothetical protein